MLNFKRLFVFFALLICSFALSDPAYITFPSDISWVTRDSAHFRALYREGHDRFSERALLAAEKAYSLLRPIFPDAPEKTWLILADFHDETNGYALDFPFPHIVIYAVPPEASGELAALDDWLSSIVLHEYVHILHLYPTRGLWKLAHTIFGTWVVPNGMMPSHLHEGIATFFETELTTGGRGKGTVFKMIQRKAVEAGVWGKSFAPLDLFDGSLTRWPLGMSPYFFGYTLYKELWSRQGRDGLYHLTESYASNWPYLVQIPLKQVYQTDYETLWKDIYEKTTLESQKEIAKIKERPLSSLNYVTDSHFSKWDLTSSPDHKALAFRKKSPSERTAIEIFDTETQKKIQDFNISGGSTEGLCWIKTLTHDWIVYLNAEWRGDYSMNFLRAHDLKSGRDILLNTQDNTLEHLHRLDCSQDGRTLLVYQETLGDGYLRELSWDGDGEQVQIRKSWKLPEGGWVSGLLSSRIPWIAIRQSNLTNFYRWEDPGEPKKVGSLGAHVYSLREANDPNHVLAVADINGRDEVWELDPARNQASQRVRLVGGVDSFTVNSKAYWLASYEQGGYDIASTKPLATAPIAVEKATTPSIVAKLPESTEISPPRSYSPLGTLVPRTWMPSLLFVPNGVQFGAWIPGFDVSQKHVYNAFGGYDTRGSAFADLSYEYRFGGKFQIDADTYLLPTYLQNENAFFKPWGGSVGIGGRLNNHLPYLHVGFLYRKLESSVYAPANQSVGLEIDASQTFGFPVRPLAISPTDGIELYANHSQYLQGLGSQDNYFATVAGFNSYFEAPWWGDSTFYFGLRSGYTEGTNFYNSFFQGGGEILFYQGRGVFLNRGFLPGTFAGRRMMTGNFEYRFPISRVDRGIGLWPLHLQTIHGALVADTTTFDFGNANHRATYLLKRYYTSAGFELKSDWKFFYYLPTEVNLGAYHGFGPYGENLYVTVGLEASL